ncbi:MAG: glycosyltransferase family 2 protein [Balneolaceae bacterium]
MVLMPVYWLLFISLGTLLATSILFLRNRFDLTPLHLHSRSESTEPKISVCIPARNEEMNIGTLLDSVVRQEWNNYEILVLDDQSSDKTPEILKKALASYPQLLTVINGKPKPAGWLGKPWACHQLGKAASGDILLFLDADTTLKPMALKGVSLSMADYNLDMLTVWPVQKLDSFWEKVVIPLIYYALVTLLPVIYVYRKPRWVPSFLERKIRPKFAAACGQCIAFTRKAYEEIGGHESVKNQVVEDVELARIARRKNLTLRMFTGINSVSCRMYRSEKEMFEGLRKNFLAGFDHSVAKFIVAGLVHLIVFILPFITFIYALVYPNPLLLFLSVGSISILLLQRLLLAQWFQWDPVYSFTHPLGVLWYQRLAAVIILDRISGRKTEWKGRKI